MRRDVAVASSFGATAQSNSFIDIVLNAAAISSINAAPGGAWAIGGSYSTAGLAIGYSSNELRQLILEVSSPVETPEPGALALLGLSLAGLGFARRRRLN